MSYATKISLKYHANPCGSIKKNKNAQENESLYQPGSHLPLSFLKLRHQPSWFS